jgi:transcriptional regulator with XRE-family HTH domain
MMQVTERLRQAREARGLDLDALARRTRLRVHMLAAVDEGRWNDLPRGVYARAVVRAYAEAVGLDPLGAVTEVAPLLPAPEDPLDGMARVRGFDRRPSAQAASAELPAEVAPAAAESPTPATAAPWEELRRIATAAAIDGSILAGAILALLLLTGAFAGAGIARVLDTAAFSVGLLSAVIVALYFFLLGGICGATAGEHWAGAIPRRPFRGTARDAWARATRSLLQEGSIIATALLLRPSEPGGRSAPSRSRTRWEAPAAAR